MATKTIDTKALEKKQEEVVDKVKERWDDFTDKDLPKIQEAYDQTRQKAEKEIRHAIDHYGSKAQETGQHLRDNMGRMTTSAGEYARQHPWQTAMTALTILSILIGFFMKARRQSSTHAAISNEIPYA